mmetsp:Transcript_74612/g.139311  ORF Transcript_74612/g.139311 Transcript_74612/m.139311 type:complete len:588 (-) Transcript_74612:149-1912(-)
MLARIIQGVLVAGFGLWYAAAEEEKKASHTDMATAGTVLGMISFVMVLYYFLLFPDQDVRQYSYEALSSTISIFCAVLSFQALDNFLEITILNHMPLAMKVCFDMMHMLFWFLVLQGTLAWVSGAVGSTFAVSELEEMDKLDEAKVKKHEKEESMRERNMKCFGILLAHISGFAAINAFGSMQQMYPFNNSAWLSFLAIPIAAVALFVLFHGMNKLRTKVSHGDDGEIDEAEKVWDEETEEAENDVFGLAVSFLLVQSLRFLICGSLADEEGEEEEEVLFSHGLGQTALLFSCGLLFVGVIFYLILNEKEEEKEEGEEGDEEKAGEKKEEGEGNPEDRSFEEAQLVAMTMGFSWAMFYGSRWLLSQTPIGGDPMVLALCVALAISIVAMLTIIPLDYLADLDFTGEKTDKAIIQTIRGLGILIGFSWEQCFDAAVGSLASGFGNAAATVKLAMAIFVVFIIVPAWHMYILPYMIEQGWKTGFVVEDAVKNLETQETVAVLKGKDKEKDMERTKKIFTACKKRLANHGAQDFLASEGYQLLPGDDATLKKEVDTLKQKFSEHVEGSLKHSQAMMERLAKIQAKIPTAA